jgi:SAM-dependent methyltransferase
LDWRLSRFDRGLDIIKELRTIQGDLGGARVADLGAAHGGDCCAFITAGARPIAVDYRNHGYGPTREYLRSVGIAFDVVLADATSTLPFKARSLDGILALNLIEHVPNRAAFLLDLWRVLEPGGFAILTTPLAWRHVVRDPFYGSRVTALLPMPMRRFVAERMLGRQYPFTLRGKTCYSSAGLLALAARAGFLGRAGKFSDSPLMSRVRRWPLPRLWERLVERYAFDFILLRKLPRQRTTGPAMGSLR